MGLELTGVTLWLVLLLPFVLLALAAVLHRRSAAKDRQAQAEFADASAAEPTLSPARTPVPTAASLDPSRAGDEGRAAWPDMTARQPVAPPTPRPTVAPSPAATRTAPPEQRASTPQATALATALAKPVPAPRAPSPAPAAPQSAPAARQPAEPVRPAPAPSAAPVAAPPVAGTPPAVKPTAEPPKAATAVAAGAPQPSDTAAVEETVESEAPPPPPPRIDYAGMVAAAEAAEDNDKLGALYIALARQQREDGLPLRQPADLLRKSIRISATNGQRMVHAVARIELGDIEAESGDMTTACEHWQIARSLFHDMSEKHELAATDARMRRAGCPTDWVLNDF